MFLDGKNQYCEHDCITQSNLHIESNPYKITNGIFHKTRTIISQFIWKYKKPQVGNTILRKKIGTGEFNLPNFRLYYEATVSMVLAQRQKYRSMEQNGKPRDTSMYLWTPHLDKGGKNIQWRKDNLFNK